ncbi:LysR substrate-binding domain-containing protein (plasmid) [Pseudoalteromonas espejiana]
MYNLETDTPIPHLAYSLDSYMGRQLEPIISGAKLNKVFVSSMTELLKVHAVAGNGIAWLPDYVISNELKNNTLVVVDEQHCVPITYYAYRYHAALHPAGKCME